MGCIETRMGMKVRNALCVEQVVRVSDNKAAGGSVHRGRADLPEPRFEQTTPAVSCCVRSSYTAYVVRTSVRFSLKLQTWIVVDRYACNEPVMIGIVRWLFSFLAARNLTFLGQEVATAQGGVSSST